MALEFFKRRRTLAPEPFPIEPNPEADLLPEEPPEVVGDEGGGRISAGGSGDRRRERLGGATGSAG